MKRLLLSFALLISGLVFSQSIDVSTTTYTVPQLVNNVLINSPCVSATNITYRTGTNFGSSNGIGFFQNTNPNFPMQSGVILSTGNVLNAAGPNSSMLNDGSTAWTGDSSLETTLAAAGISMTSTNASVLEFDFTPISPNFSFDFVFASEEYGNFQCQYSDAFAFLLTNTSTGVTTNLAVVPNTNLPISVITIRDFLYNSSCPSANSQYFGNFNGGSNATTSATNFNGQTKVLTASSVVTPNVTYHIKLVIADRLDPQSDSAIFISSDSFNIGQDVLGQDLTIANGTALCYGTTHTLNSGLDPNTYSFVWKKDGDIIPGQTGNSLTVTQAGNYSLTYNATFATCEPITDNVTIEYYPQINAANPNTLYKCDSGSATYNYNLDLNTSVVKAGLDPNTSVKYFATQNDANNDTNALPLIYNTASGTTIWVRIQLPNSPCFVVKSFQLQTAPGPIANQAPNLELCARSQSLNNAFFNIAQQTPIILGSQSPTMNIISYHTSLNDATNDINAYTGNLSYAMFPSTTIYVRVENASDPTCYSISSFNLIVNPVPLVDVLQNVIACNSYTLQPLTNGNYFTQPNGGGTMMNAGDIITETTTLYIFNQPGGPNTCGANSMFNVKIIDPNTFSPNDINSCGPYTITEPEFGNYYTQPGGAGTMVNPGTVISSTQTLYLYFETTVEPFCEIDTDINVNIVPSIEVGQRDDVFECSSYTLPSLSLGNYYTGPAGTGNMLTAGTVITTSQTIYVYASASSGETSCSDQDVFEVIIGMPQPSDVAQCNGYTLPQLPIGNYYTGPMGTGTLIPAGTFINENSTIYIYAPTTSGTNNCTDNMHFSLTFSQPQVDVLQDVTVCESYTLPTLTYGEYRTEADGNGTLLHAGDVIISSQTIYIFRRLDESCANQSSFNVTINSLPEIDSRSDIDICDQYVLTALTNGNYYTEPNGGGTMLTAGTVITTSQKIYIYAVSNTTPACSAENSFQINIFSTSADQPANVSACDSYTLPALTEGNKYYTQSGGPNGLGTEIAPGTTITSTQTIYVFKESVIRTSFSCVDENMFTVTINHTPVIAPIANVKVCNSYTLPSLSVGNYYTGTNATGTMLNAGDQITTTQTIYVYAHTATTPDCFSEISFNVTVFNVDDLPNVTTCESYTLPALVNGKYYTGQNGTGTLIPAGTTISTSQTLYVYSASPFSPTCYDESTLVVTIIDTPISNPVPTPMRTTCDEDGTNDGVTSFNLTTLNSTILGSQTGSEFSVTYYNSLQDAQAGTNSVTASTNAIVYAKVSNSLAPNCFDVKPIAIIVNKLPEPTPKDGVVCIDAETGALLNSYTMYSGLSQSGHTFVWKNEAGEVVGHNTAYTATLPGVYTLVVTKNSTGCSSEEIQINVIQSEPAVITYSVDDEFSDNQTLTITANGQGGEYEYQLDNGPFQDSNVFYDVTSGVHTVTVNDKNGCGSVTMQVVVVNYPKFFTPNGDGYNDTWNIRDLKNQPNAIIDIYDRYGKILTQIKPNSSGWDGTYNGRLVMSDDYWFTVSYEDENHIKREFKAHFAMKR